MCRIFSKLWCHLGGMEEMEDRVVRDPKRCGCEVGPSVGVRERRGVARGGGEGGEAGCGGAAAGDAGSREIPVVRGLCVGECVCVECEHIEGRPR
jgi:hypothetical protein